MSEAPRFNADMVLSFGAAQAIDGTKKGYYVPYKSPAWEDIDAAFKSPDGSYYAFGYFLISVDRQQGKTGRKRVWDADELEGASGSQMERTDCGSLAPDIRHGLHDQLLFSPTLRRKGGLEVPRSAGQNMAQYTKSGNAPTDLVGRGEYLLGITADENVLKRINDGYPIQWVIPAEGIGYEGNYCVILKGTKKLDLSKKVMDYLGTKDASEFLASMGYIPPRPGIPSALYGAAKTKIHQA